MAGRAEEEEECEEWMIVLKLEFPIVLWSRYPVSLDLAV